MVTVYVTLVIAGVENGGRSFESVPAGLKKAVENELRAIGLGTDGKPLEG